MHGRRRAKLTQRFEQRRLACSFSGNRAPFSRTRGWKSSPDFRQNLSAGNLRRLVRLQLGQIQVASTAIHLHLLHGHRPRLRPIQTPNRPFGFWILEFGVWILDFGFWILDFGSWIWDFGFWILDLGFWILDFGSV